MIFRQIASIFQFNGGEIFQKKRVDKSRRRTGSGTRKSTGEGTPGEPEAESAREPGKELRMRIGNEVWKRTGNGTRKGIGDETPQGGSEREPAREPEARLTQHSGNWLPRMEQESSYSECDDGRGWKARASLAGPKQF